LAFIGLALRRTVFVTTPLAFGFFTGFLLFRFDLRWHFAIDSNLCEKG
jgi:hypothetical protein